MSGELGTRPSKFSTWVTQNSVLMSTTITNPTEGALKQLGSLCRLLCILDLCKMRHRFAEQFAERLFK